MARISEQDTQKLLEDIAAIKSAIAKSRPIMKQLLLPEHFKVVSYVSGAGIVTVSMIYYLLLKYYTSYSAIPEALRIVMIGVITVLLLTVWILKGLLWMKSVRTVNKDLGFFQMLGHLYSGQILHVWTPVTILNVFFVLFFYRIGRMDLIVPLLCFGVGFIYNMIGGMTKSRQFLITGYWLFLTGCLSIVFDHVSALIWLTVSLGFGLIFFGAACTKMKS